MTTDLSAEYLKACQSGRLSEVKDFLNSDPTIFSKKKHKNAGVLAALWNSDRLVVQLLMYLGVEQFGNEYFSRKTTKNETPLHGFSMFGDDDLIKRAIASGALVDVRTSGKRTPIHIAAQYGMDHTIRLLIDSGADVNAKEKSQRSALHFTTKASTIKLLVSLGANVNAVNKWGDTPLHERAHKNSLSACQALIESGAHINARSNAGDTPLIQACKNEDCFDAAILLLQAGADEFISNDKNSTIVSLSKTKVHLRTAYNAFLAMNAMQKIIDKNSPSTRHRENPPALAAGRFRSR